MVQRMLIDDIEAIVPGRPYRGDSTKVMDYLVTGRLVDESVTRVLGIVQIGYGASDGPGLLNMAMGIADGMRLVAFVEETPAGTQLWPDLRNCIASNGTRIPEELIPPDQDSGLGGRL